MCTQHICKFSRNVTWLLRPCEGRKVLHVCVSVCPLACLKNKNHTCSDFTKLSVRFLWPWLISTVTIMQCYVLLVFVDDIMTSCFHTVGHSGVQIGLQPRDFSQEKGIASVLQLCLFLHCLPLSDILGCKPRSTQWSLALEAKGVLCCP